MEKKTEKKKKLSKGQTARVGKIKIEALWNESRKSINLGFHSRYQLCFSVYFWPYWLWCASISTFTVLSATASGILKDVNCNHASTVRIGNIIAFVMFNKMLPKKYFSEYPRFFKVNPSISHFSTKKLAITNLNEDESMIYLSADKGNASRIYMYEYKQKIKGLP